MFEMMEQEHELAVHQKEVQFTEEEMAMARYDHLAADVPESEE
jgi:hypothetical protein